MKAYEWQLARLRQAKAEGWRRHIQKVRCGIGSQVRRALLDRHKTPDRYKAAIGCTYRELAIHIESQFQPGMTWENMGEWHIDHIVPVAYFLETDPEGFACNHYTNLQPLWAKDNLSKGAKLCR